MKTIMALVNQYGEIVSELERVGCFYHIPAGDMDVIDLAEGDELRVESIVVEEV